MSTSFLDSPLRKLLFPYLEGADNEDPTRPSHWMSSLSIEALGLDSSASSSTTSSSSSSLSSSSSSSSSSSPRKRRRSAFQRSSNIQRASSIPFQEDASLTAFPLSCNDLNELRAVPWASIYFHEHHKAQDTCSDQGDDEEDDIAAVGTFSPRTSLDTHHFRQQRRATLPSAVSTQDHGDQSATVMQQPSRQVARSASFHGKPTQGVIKPDRLRRVRGASAPTPLTPAQPLERVNTALPLQLPPTVICLQGPAKHSVETLPLRRSRSGCVVRQGDSSLLSSPSTGSLVLSGESDGSYYGDAGDDDPEAQLAAGIARLKANKKVQVDSTKAPNSEAERSSKMGRMTVLATRDASDDDIDGAHDSASQLISDHAGFISSLADVVLEFKIRRTGPFRGRATSAINVSAFARNTADQGALPRSQSHDTLLDNEHSGRYGNRPSFGPALVSTPGSLRGEVAKWSAGRRPRASESDLSRSSLNQLPSSRRPQPFTPAGSSSAFSFVRNLLHRSAAYRLCVSIAEGLAGEEDEQDCHATYISSSPSQAESDEEDGDDSDEQPNSTAYSSLWASPVVSRSSSSYNLNLLSDEPSAFEQDEGTALSSVSTSTFPSRGRRERQTSVRGVQKLSPFTTSTVPPALIARRDDLPTKHTVSPLWDVNHTAGNEAEDQDSFDENISRPAFERSWSRVLGMSL